MIVGTPLNNHTNQPANNAEAKKGGLFIGLPILALGIVAGAFIARKALRVTKSDELEEKPEKSAREIADEEKKKLTPSELGKLGAKKRWEKKRAEEAKALEGGENEPASV